MSTKVQSFEVSGVQLVTIPAGEYADLLASRRHLQEATLSTSQLFDAGKSLIDRNPEVAVFLAQRFGLMEMTPLLRLCRKKFGRDRTPSRSAAYRYWKKLREEALKRP